MKKISFALPVLLLLLLSTFSFPTLAEENPPPGPPQDLTFCNLTYRSVRLKIKYLKLKLKLKCGMKAWAALFDNSQLTGLL